MGILVFFVLHPLLWAFVEASIDNKKAFLLLWDNHWSESVLKWGRKIRTLCFKETLRESPLKVRRKLNEKIR